jgi:zinc transport system substrate-binding protein
MIDNGINIFGPKCTAIHVNGELSESRKHEGIGNDFPCAYGLIQYSLEPDGKEPTPRRMAALVDFAKKEDIGVIYIQSDLDKSQARVFAEEINGEVVEMWPLNPKWFDNLRDITGLLIKYF